MSDDTPQSDDSPVESLVREARLVFGAVLVDGTPHLIECIDHDRFADGTVDEALGAAFASIGADLVPFVVDAGEQLDGVSPAPSGAETSGEHPTITAFDEAVAALSDGGTYYVLVNAGSGTWKRVRKAASGSFEAGAQVNDSEAARYRVGSALVAETSDRIGDLPGVAGEDIEIIDWSN